jgi:hypothetical protein
VEKRKTKHHAASQLRRAARSCNEWRDTLFCTGLLALAVACEQFHLPLRPSMFLWFVVAREMCRGLAWCAVNQRFAITAVASSAIIVLALDGLSAIGAGNRAGPGIGNAVSIAMILSVIPAVLVCSGGLRGVYSTYRKTLFDWPRKISPPPKPRDSRLLERLQEAWQGLLAGAGAEGSKSSARA